MTVNVIQNAYERRRVERQRQAERVETARLELLRETTGAIIAVLGARVEIVVYGVSMLQSDFNDHDLLIRLHVYIGDRRDVIDVMTVRLTDRDGLWRVQDDKRDCTTGELFNFLGSQIADVLWSYCQPVAIKANTTVDISGSIDLLSPDERAVLADVNAIRGNP